MLISLVTFLTAVLFLKGTESFLLEPVKQCVPTTIVRGPCHTCMCSHEGVFHCRQQKCEDKYLGRSRYKTDCEPNYLFRQNNTLCRCSSDGFWLSDNCGALFRYLYPRANIPDKNLSTNIQCTANTLYLIDCNVCKCPASGIIDVTLCTSRTCIQGRKTDSCTYGDILRFNNQLCSCSDINFFIDRLCIKILDEVVQPLETADIIKLDDIGKPWRRQTDLESDVCDANIVYTIDCDVCICVDDRLDCTKNVCEKKTKNILRNERLNEIDSLPELKSDGDIKCEPGMKYRNKCNVCTCTKDGVPSCTTMICLQNLVVDIKALRGVFWIRFVLNKIIITVISILCRVNL